MSKLEQNKGPWTVEGEAIGKRKSNLQEYVRTMSAGKLSKGRVEAASLHNSKCKVLVRNKSVTILYRDKNLAIHSHVVPGSFVWF